MTSSSRINGKDNLREIQLRIDLQERRKLLGGKSVPCRRFESLGERRQLLRAHRQAAGELMTAELFQMFGAAAERLDHVKAADAARRAFADAVVESNHHCRPIKTLDDARRDDAEHTGMPTLAGQDQRMAVAASNRRFRLRQGMQLHLRFDGAPFEIMFFQFLGDALRGFAGVRRQEFDDFDAVIDPAGGIDARSQAKSHLPSADFAIANPGDTFECHHAGPCRSSQLD